MTLIPSARGALDTADLGFTLMHEHIFLLSHDLYASYPQLFERAAEVDRAVATLDEAYDHGVRTVVDLTTVDLGRDIGLVAEVAARTRMQIVVATGVHLNPPAYFQRRNPDPVLELYLRDLNEGIAGTDVRAGAIKIATEELTPANEFQVRIAAMAHRATGTPLMTHSNPTIGSGADQQRVFDEEGVDLERVVIGHSGDTTDVDYLSRLMERGSTIGMDRFGAPIGASTEERIETIAELCRRGYADRMVLSHDTACHFNGVLPEVMEERMPEWHFLLITNHVLPELERLGVTGEQIEAMMVANPRRIFEAQGAY
ncbi:MAG: phosphotriesterase [Chloroflexi bacterium]|nr:phosphotriesterase [Chloroflexota bacterium]MYD64425.1 phosphotriesterase [Chloroflexota bacterium]